MSDRGEELNMAFARHLLEDGKSPKTVESYTGDVLGFLRHLRAAGDSFDGELQRHQVTAYRNHLLQSGYEPATVNKKVNSLQAFNRFLVAAGLMAESVVDLRRDRVCVASGSEKQVEVYPEVVLGRLLSFVGKKRVSARDRAVVLVLLYTGVRVSELCGIRVRSVDLANGLLKVVGKGGKLREVPLRPEVADALRAYLAERAKSRFAGSEFLFLGQRGPLQRDAVNTLLERLARRFGLQVRLKPHTFRLVHYKQKHVYVGIDLHKETHTAVVIDCWNKKLAEVQVSNRPTAFPTLLEKVRRVARGLQPVFGLEDVGGYGRSLAVFLLEKGQAVKEVNAALSYAQRISNPTTQKSDS